MSAENASQPVGAIVDGTSADRPGPVTLEGRYTRIEKLDPKRHGEALWEAMKGHDELWAYLAFGPFRDHDAFFGWLDERAVILDPYAYAVVDKATGRAIGTKTRMETRPTARVIEVGSIIYSPVMQRTPVATEAQFLLMSYAFETLRNRRYEWKCNALNAPSMRAAKRFGFTYEGTFRQHMIVKGRNRDTAWFSIVDSEWPGIKLAFERWLAPENFDQAGQQKTGLAELRQQRERA